MEMSPGVLIGIAGGAIAHTAVVVTYFHRQMASLRKEIETTHRALMAGIFTVSGEVISVKEKYANLEKQLNLQATHCDDKCNRIDDEFGTIHRRIDAIKNGMKA